MDDREHCNLKEFCVLAVLNMNPFLSIAHPGSSKDSANAFRNKALKNMYSARNCKEEPS